MPAHASGTLADPSAAGRLQRLDEERVSVESAADDTVLHVPPPADQLPDRLARLCDLANGVSDEQFVHPVIRAIIVHLWLAIHATSPGSGPTTNRQAARLVQPPPTVWVNLVFHATVTLMRITWC